MAGAVTTDDDDDEEEDVATVVPALVGGLVADGDVEQPRSATVARVHTTDRARRLDTRKV